MIDYKERLKNPFLPQKADYLKDEAVIKFFANHTKFAPISNRGHQIIFGASGTGKTIGLRYFSLKNQVKAGHIDLHTPPPFIGVYLPLGKQSDIWKKKKPTDDIFRLYENALNLELSLEIAKTLDCIYKNNYWGIKPQNISDLLLCPVIFDNSFQETSEFIKNLHTKKNQILTFVDQNKDPQINSFKDSLSLSINTYVPNISENIILSTDILKSDTLFYFLLDQYDELVPWQQKILNSLIRRPTDYYYVKLGSRPFGIYDETTVTNRSIREALEGVIDLQYYRNEVEMFRDVLLNITSKRLDWEVNEKDLLGLAKELLPEENPVKTVINEHLKEMQQTAFKFTKGDTIEEKNILDELTKLAKGSNETQRKFRSAIYQGFDQIVDISDGNIGIYNNLLSDMWENARIKGLTKSDSRKLKLPSSSQINAVWNLSNFKVEAIESGIEDDGIYLLNLVNKICETFEKNILSGNSYHKTHDLEMGFKFEIPLEVKNIIRKGLQYGVFIPLSSTGYLTLPHNFNLSNFILPKYGLSNVKCPTFILEKEEFNDLFSRSPETISIPTKRGTVNKAFEGHLGFLSISFRKEEPASQARKRIQEIFKETLPQIQCFDIETIEAPIGSPHLLAKITKEIKKAASFCLIEISNITPNVMIEFGLAKGLRKLFWVLVHKEKIGNVPDWVGGFQLRPYSFDKNDEFYLDNMVNKKIIQTLAPMGKIEDYCPIRRSISCTNVTRKDPSKVFISYPGDDDLWIDAISELKNILFTDYNRRLITVDDIKHELKETPHKTCEWCYAIRSSGIVFVDTTPYHPDKSGLGNDPTQCFILGLAFGQKQKKQTHCVHLYKKEEGQDITLWKGYPSYEWRTKEEIIKIVKREIEAKSAR